MFISKYRKPHLVWLRQNHFFQQRQISQRGTIEFLHFRGSTCNAIRIGEYEALRRVISRKLYRTLRFFLTRRANVVVTSKPREIRMGKGKGSFSHFLLPVPIGGYLAGLAWCHRLPLPFVVMAGQRSIKKSSLRLYF